MPEKERVSQTPFKAVGSVVIIPPPLAERAWSGLVAEWCQDPPGYFDVLPRSEHIVTFYLGHPMRAMQQRAGQVHYGLLRPGDVLVTAANQPNSWHSDRVSEYLQLHLSSSFLQQVAASIDAGKTDRAEIRDNFGTRDPIIESLGHQLLRELRSEELGSRLYGESLAQLLAVHLLRQYSVAGSPPDQQTPGLPQHLLRTLIAYINDSLERDISLTELAAVAGMSPSYLLKMFKQSTGLPPHQYLIRCRVEQARQLLLGGELSISEVAATVGFCDQSRLTRQMKRVLGVTPTVVFHPRRSLSTRSKTSKT